MAKTRKRRRSHTIGKKRSPRRRRRAVVVVGRRHHTRRRRRSVGAVGRTHHTRRRRRRSVGATSHKGLMKRAMQFGEMALGAASGFAANHYILRPLENKIQEKMPAAAKVMGIAHAGLGFWAAMWGIKKGNLLVVGAGSTLFVGGVHSSLRQFKLAEKLGIHGPGDEGYHTLRIPISGSDTKFESMVAGLLTNNGTPKMPTVMDMGEKIHHTSASILHNTESGNRMDPRFHAYVGEGEGGDPYDTLYTAKGVNY